MIGWIALIWDDEDDEMGVVARACAGGISYFCNCNKYASAVGIVPQHTSRVVVLARTSCTRDGGGGFSTMECK